MLFKDAIYGFKLYLLSANYSPVTANNYTHLLTCLLRQIENIEVQDITRPMLVDYLQSIRARGCTESTAHSHWRTIRSFFNWAEKELSIVRPDDIPGPDYKTKVVEPFTKEEIERLLKACKNKRSKAIVLFLLDTGLRSGEACRVQIKDIYLETGIVEVRPFHNGLKSRPRSVRIGNLARKSLWSYLASRTDLKTPDAPLLATVDGKSLERYGIHNILLRIGKNAGVKNANPHRFRHTFAIQYLRNGGDIFTLQELLGHSSFNMIRRYLAIAKADVTAAHRKASPVDNWRL